MSKEKDYYVIHNPIGGDIFIVDTLRKCESIQKHLSKFYKLTQKPDKAILYSLDEFFTTCEFSKDKIQLCWRHQTNELMNWYRKVFSIRNRVL